LPFSWFLPLWHHNSWMLALCPKPDQVEDVHVQSNVISNVTTSFFATLTRPFSLPNVVRKSQPDTQTIVSITAFVLVQMVLDSVQAKKLKPYNNPYNENQCLCKINLIILNKNEGYYILVIYSVLSI